MKIDGESLNVSILRWAQGPHHLKIPVTTAPPPTQKIFNPILVGGGANLPPLVDFV